MPRYNDLKSLGGRRKSGFGFLPIFRIGKICDVSVVVFVRGEVMWMV
jgi:hypothetical protein